MSDEVHPIEPSEPDDPRASQISVLWSLDDTHETAQASKAGLRLTLGAVALSSLGTAASVWGSGLWFAVFVFTSLAVVATLALLSDVFGWRPFSWIPIGLRSARSAPTLPLEQALEELSETVYIDLSQPMGDPTLEGLPVVPLGDGLFAVARMTTALETELFDYRDILELDELTDGSYVLRGIHARSGWSRYDAMLPIETLATQALQDLLTEVSARGGLWMQYMGGCLAVSMPPDSDWDFYHELESVGDRQTPAP